MVKLFLYLWCIWINHHSLFDLNLLFSAGDDYSKNDE